MAHSKRQILLEVVSQEKKLLSQQVDSVTLTTSEGELTILPDHIALFSEVYPGELVYRSAGQEESVVVSHGFVNVYSPEDKVVVMVDRGVLSQDINIQRAEEAIAAAHATMLKTQDQRELMMAEASLRQAMLEIKVAQKTKRTKI
ncbi:MAG: ATP synthase F1 subunit epsilon [Patescibacteria group bacterium]